MSAGGEGGGKKTGSFGPEGLSAQRTSGGIAPWLVVAGCFLLYGCIVGVLINCTGLFISAILEDCGFSNSSMSLYYTIRTAVVAVFISFASHIYLKVNFRIFRIVYILMSAAVYGLMFLYQRPWHWYISAAICGIVLSLTSIMTASLIKNWFLKKTNTIMGICFAGSGITAALASPLISRLIRAAGWRQAALVVGIITLAVTAAGTFLFPERSPEAAGKQAYGAAGKQACGAQQGSTVPRQGNTVPGQGSAESAPEAAGAAGHPESPASDASAANGADHKEDIRSVIIFLGILGGVLTGQVLNNYLAQFTISIGYTLEISSLMVSAFMIGNLISKIIYGVTADRIGVWKTVCCFYVILLAGYLLLFLQKSPGALGAAAFLLGASCSFTTIAWTSLCLREYGKDNYEIPYGHLSTAGNIATMLILFLVGAAVDAAGSYYPVFRILFLLCVISAAVSWIRRERKKSI